MMPTAAEVLADRAEGLTYAQIAEKYKISQTSAYRIDKSCDPAERKRFDLERELEEDAHLFAMILMALMAAGYKAQLEQSMRAYQRRFGDENGWH